MPTTQLFSRRIHFHGLIDSSFCGKRTIVSRGLYFRTNFRAEPGRVEIPVLLQAVTAILVAIPCTKIGYTVMRQRAEHIKADNSQYVFWPVALSMLLYG